MTKLKFAMTYSTPRVRQTFQSTKGYNQSAICVDQPHRPSPGKTNCINVETVTSIPFAPKRHRCLRSAFDVVISPRVDGTCFNNQQYESLSPGRIFNEPLSEPVNPSYYSRIKVPISTLPTALANDRLKILNPLFIRFKHTS